MRVRLKFLAQDRGLDMLLAINLALAMHHFGVTYIQAILFIGAVLMFVFVQWFWPYEPDYSEDPTEG